MKVLYTSSPEDFIPIITIGSTIIDFPNSGTSPNWASAVDAFAVAVEGALSGLVGPFDVPPQVLVIDSYNPGTNINIPSLSFSTSVVRGAFIRYTVYRSTSLTNAYEIGELRIVYNPTGPTNNKWEVGRQFVGDGEITFTVTDVGQVQFTTTALSGINHTGQLTFTAQALLQTG